MVESADQAAAAVSASKFPPAGIRSFGPLRPSLGIDPAEIESRADVFVMIETLRGLEAVDRIAAVPGLSGLYVGPADLAISMGYGPTQAWTAPAMADAMKRAEVAASAHAVVAGIHAGSGKLGKTAAHWNFRMITLTSESQALRRGVAEHLDEAQ
jgi:4-hydroxy-2-oxoheptanedioate aldolase